jgi:DNA polymerase III alpha subunit (gram-positive type)
MLLVAGDYLDGGDRVGARGSALELRDGLQRSIIEMHVHTAPTSSDSMLDPHDLIRCAREVTLTGVNLTEHDQVLEPHQQAAFREQ